MEIDTIIQKFGDPPPVLEIVETNVDGYKKTSFINDDGEHVDNYSAVTGGHNVQVIVYDGNERNVLVFVDDSARMMPKTQVLDYIKRRISD